jgi:hypothetical protein
VGLVVHGPLLKAATWLPYFLPGRWFPASELSESRSGGFNSFGRMHFRPLPTASLPSIIFLPGIDIIHFAHRSWPAEILIKSVGGLWSSAVPIVVKYQSQKAAHNPPLQRTPESSSAVGPMSALAFENRRWPFTGAR